MKRMMMAVFAAVLSVVSAAEDAVETTRVWWNTTNMSEYADMQWGIPERWNDDSGNPLTVAPTNAADRYEIRLPMTAENAKRTIYTGELSGADGSTYLAYPSVNPSVYSVLGSNDVFDTWGWTLNIGYFRDYKKPGFKRSFSIVDPSGYEGLWEVGDSQTVIELLAGVDHVPALQSLSAKYRPYVKVPEAGTKAAVKLIYTPGTVVKRGAGELEVGQPTVDADDTMYIAEEGTLSFEGKKGDEVETLFAKAAVRFDASRPDTLELSEGEDCGESRVWVDKWKDADGRNVHGAADLGYGNSDPTYLYTFTRPPFICKENSPTDLPLVDFGMRHDEVKNGVVGTTNCTMRIYPAISRVKEVFYSAWTPGGAKGRTIVGTLGNDGLFAVSDPGNGGVFCGYAAGEPARRGDMMINGKPVRHSETMSAASEFYAPNLTNICVISTGIGESDWQFGVPVFSLMGCDRYYHSRSGGCRIGEVIVFTNALTRAERVRISRYLTEKWLGKPNRWDAGTVITSEGTDLKVASGKTAGVGVVSAPSGVFEKSGEGKLEVGAVYPSRANVEVSGGSLKFATAQDVAAAPTAPASDPWIWLDAGDGDNKFTFLEREGDDGKYPLFWKDHRDDCTLEAFAVSNVYPNVPKMEIHAASGKTLVGLGTFSKKTHSWISLPTWGADGGYGSGTTVREDTYAAFMVYRPLEKNSTRNLFGSSDLTMMKGNATGILSDSYTYPHSSGAFWSLNGIPVDPWGNHSAVFNDTNSLVLVAFRSDIPLTMNAIAKDRKGQQLQSAGSIAVGEFISYHRKMTAAEFRDTEAYLLRKWMNRAHPLREDQAIGTLSFGAGVAAVVDADRDVTVDRIEASGNSFEKSGIGSVSVGRLPRSAVEDSVSVKGGVLSAEPSGLPDPLFHFDASAEDSLHTYTGEDGRVFVTRWDDLSTNGIFACSSRYIPKYSEYSTFVMTNATVVTETMPDGKERQVLDFGGIRNTASQQESGTNAAAFYFSREVNGSVLAVKNVREIYMVQRQVFRGAHFIANISGGAPLAAVSKIYMRGGDSLFHTTYTSQLVQDGYLAIDRQTATASTTLGNDWHVVSVGATDNTTVEGIMQDRNCNAGGGMVAEMIAFSDPLTDAQREEIERRLMAKWGIGNETELPVAIGEVEVAAGAVLDLGGRSVESSALKGEGTVKCSSLLLTGLSRLDIGWRSADDVDCVTVDAPVTFGEGLKVTVSVADDAVVSVGEWPIFAVAGGIGVEVFSKISLEHGFGSKWAVSHFLKDGKLMLSVKRRGMTVTLR